MSIRPLVLLGLLLLAPDSARAVPVTRPELADEVFRQLQHGRREAGAPELERRSQLDAAALERAQSIAAMPASRRLGGREPIGELLERVGVKRYRSAFEHLDLKRGYTDLSAAFGETWKNYSTGWKAAMNPEVDAAGLAVVRASDGWVILAALLVEDQKRLRVDLKALERETVRAINEIRSGHGLPRLELRRPVAEAARSHSEEMARLGYFDHESPLGLQPADRVAARGVRYARVAENIQLNTDPYDPVKIAVDSWMASDGHRANILDPRFDQTGVGIAVDKDQTFHFTQLFVELPPGND